MELLIFLLNTGQQPTVAAVVKDHSDKHK